MSEHPSELTDAIQAMFAEEDARREYMIRRREETMLRHAPLWRLAVELMLYALGLLALGLLLRAVA